MTGLEKILEEIKKETNENIDQIKNQAQDEYSRIVKQQESNIRELEEKFETELENRRNLDIKKGQSAALSKKNQMILSKKQQAISEIIEKAKNYITNLEKEEYISFLEKIALKYAHKEEGILMLTEKDKDSIGEEFINRINPKLQENSKGKLSLSDKATKEKSGFVIIYDDIEENCSLEAIFSEKRDILEDKISEFLFE